jgi:hypothetical protein
MCRVPDCGRLKASLITGNRYKHRHEPFVKAVALVRTLQDEAGGTGDQLRSGACRREYKLDDIAVS